MLRKASYYQFINLGFGLLIDVLISYYQLFITYMKLLALILLSKTLDVFLDLRPVEDSIKSPVFVSPFVVGLSVSVLSSVRHISSGMTH